MLCQLCKVNNAAVKITQVINNKKIEINFCRSCAEKKGVDNPLGTLPQIFGNFVAELLGQETLHRKDKSSHVKCNGCGLTWEHFQKTGLFGCDICYLVFEDDLKVILRRIHGSNQHIGNRPNSKKNRIDEPELEKIKMELQAAIKNEDFELAAELRDIIRDAQREIDKKSHDGILR